MNNMKLTNDNNKSFCEEFKKNIGSEKNGKFCELSNKRLHAKLLLIMECI